MVHFGIKTAISNMILKPSLYDPNGKHDDIHVYFCNFMDGVYLLQVYFQPDISIVELT
jgi:hypothetical protein